jgi:mRNA interferase RelE/StbE
MTYEIFIGDDAEKQMRHLPRDVLNAVDRAIAGLADEPRPHGCRKIVGTDKGWRIVVRRHYRVLYEIEDETREVFVYRVARREKDTYRR